VAKVVAVIAVIAVTVAIVTATASASAAGRVATTRPGAMPRRRKAERPAPRA
jgi:hypothetical protein